MNLILASASPRRAEILRDAGIAFEVLAVNVDETPRAGESAEAMCRRLAEAKARAAAARLGAPAEPVIVVAADTTVEIDGEILGKPASPDEARQVLRRLSGRTHRVLTALSLLRLPDGAARSDLESTAVRFSALSEREIDEYAATGEPMDKAGAYAIQGRAGCFIEGVEGCYFNVVGLPLARLYRNLKELGWPPSGDWKQLGRPAERDRPLE
jgi:nucleoside triphosphate pyrophosphatase